MGDAFRRAAITERKMGFMLSKQGRGRNRICSTQIIVAQYAPCLSVCLLWDPGLRLNGERDGLEILNSSARTLEARCLTQLNTEAHMREDRS